MKRTAYIAAALICAGGILTCSCASATIIPEVTVMQTPTSTPTPTLEPTPTPDPVKSLIASMSDSELLSQMIMIGIYGTQDIDEVSRTLISADRAANVIYFARNVQNPQQLKALSDKLQALSPAKLPMFIAVDEEGGRVSRLPYTDKTAAARDIGDAGDPQTAYAAGETIARRMRECGCNIDFAPVLDIQTNAQNTVIGNRAYGTDAQKVCDMALAMFHGLDSEGIIAVGKHFPGHGDTYADSHKELPHTSHTMERLESVELVPFREAVRAGIPAILVSHIMNENIDPENPASMSATMVTELLRQKLGFEGMVVTDDMTMGAIVSQYDLGEACVKSVLAGCDLIVICHEDEYRTQSVEALEKAVAEGTITRERLEQSAERIIKIKLAALTE